MLTVQSSHPYEVCILDNGVPSLLTVHGHQVFNLNWTLKKVFHRIVFRTKYTQEIITVSEPFKGKKCK